MSPAKRASLFFFRPRAAVWLLGTGLLLSILGVKFIVIDRYGSDIPNWDQWDAEEQNLLIPYFEHRLGFLGLFVPHNEHRIAPTKALNLGLTLLNGQWDARLECMVNALLHAATALAVFLYGRRLFPDRRLAVWAVLVLVVFGMPLAWSNIISGFHSVQYFLVGFSLAAIGLLVEARAFSARWFAGVVCAGCAVVSMGAGFFASATVIGALALAHGPIGLYRRHLATTSACLVAIVAGWFLRVEVSYHEPLKAHSLGEFLATIYHYLQWPLREVGWFAALSFAPWMLLVWRAWRRRERANPREVAIVGAGIWVLLQILASAYARGAGGGWPADRYLDSLTIGILANGAAILLLLPAAGKTRHLWTQATLFAIWSACILIGVANVGSHSIRQDLPTVKEYFVKAERSVRAYLATGDDSFLDDDQSRPYPGKQTLIDRLAPSEIRSILPASIRPPLRLEGTSTPPEAFVIPAPDYVFATPWKAWRSGSPLEPPRTGEWRSAPLPKGSYPFWRFEVTGHPGAADVSLQIVERASGRVLADLVPRRSAAGAWRPVYVRAPDVDAVLIAHESSPEKWLGFTEPVEIARLSLVTIWVVKQGMTLAAIGAVLLTGGLVATWRLSPPASTEKSAA